MEKKTPPVSDPAPPPVPRPFRETTQLGNESDLMDRPAPEPTNRSIRETTSLGE